MAQDNESTRIRLIIADDHSVVRKGINDHLGAEPDMEVVGEAEDGREAVRLAIALLPDVMIMDVAMPHVNGVEATRQMRRVAPSVKVLVLSGYDDAPYVDGLLDAGASGYLMKTASLQAIAQAVRDTAAGRRVLDAAVSQHLIERIIARPAGGETLSDREREVLQHAVRGLTNKQIGAILGISDRTVQNHLASIFEKLGAASRTEAVTIALQRGWIQL
jgi:DNA-binding NarL/FixJ family response regulator